jgi:hypothetical protein
MAYTQTWSLPLDEVPIAVSQWEPGSLFLGYNSGLLEIRSTTDGAVLAQGYSPFDAYGGSGGVAINGVGYCKDGLGVVVAIINGFSHVATVRANLAAKSMDVGQIFSIPLADGQPGRPPDDRAVSYTTLMRDGAPMGGNFYNPALATTATGGMLLIPLYDRGSTQTTTPGQPIPGDQTTNRTATLFAPGSGEVSYFDLLVTRTVGSSQLVFWVTNAFTVDKFDFVVVTYTTQSGRQQTGRYSDAADKQPGETSVFAVGKGLSLQTSFEAGDPLQHVRITRTDRDGVLLDVLSDGPVVYDPVPSTPGPGTVTTVQNAPGMLGAWFDVAGYDDIRWTATRAEIVEPGQWVAVISAGLRALSQTKFRTAFQEFDREAPMPIPAVAPAGVPYGTVLEASHQAATNSVINLVPYALPDFGGFPGGGEILT